MYNIRNIHLDNVGFKDAWFRNLHIPLYEHHSKKVSNTVLSLTNGGGKTTILSLIFSCFVPEQRNFIQHLQKPAHKFKDYFEKSPGLILIELEKLAEKESNLFDEKLIIGQYVYISSTDNEPVRYFFSFEPDSFSYDDLPSYGNGTIKSKSDLKKWINEASKTYSNFFCTPKQQDWKNWLDKNNVDTWLAEKQVGFCRSEGGIDKFMSFKSERDFLKEFFYMSLSTEDSNDVRSVLTLSLKKLKKRPLFEKQSNILKELKVNLSKFSNDGKAYSNALEKNREYLKDSKSLYRSFGSDLKDLKITISNKQSQLKKDSKTIELTEEKIDENKNREDYLNFLLLKNQLDNEKLRLKKNESNKEKFIEEELTCKAALIYKKIDSIENEIKGLKSSIEEDLSVKDSKENFDRKASILKAKIELKISDFSKERKNLNDNLSQLKIKNIEIENQTSSLIDEKNKFSEDIAVLNSFTKLKESSEQKLKTSGIFSEGLTPDQGLIEIDRLIKNKKNQLKTDNKTLDESISNLEKLNKKLDGIIDLKNEDEAKKEKLLSILELAQNEKKAICENRYFIQLIGSNDFDPENIEIKGILDSYIERLKLKTNKILIEKEKDSDDLIKIKGSNSSLVNKSTVEALKLLKENNIQSAKLFTDYLSEHYKEDLKSIKDHIESNPGRYTGICVNPDDFKKVKTLVDKFDLKSPVVVSLCELEIYENPFITLFGTDLKPLSREESKSIIISLEKKIRDTDKNLEKLNSELDDLYQLNFNIKNYLLNYSGGKLSKYSSELNLIDNNIENIISDEESLIKEKLELEVKIKAVTDSITEFNDDLNKLKYKKSTLNSFIIEFHNKSSENNRKLENLSKKLIDHKSIIDENISQCKEIELDIDKTSLEISKINDLIQKLREEISYINCEPQIINDDEFKNISLEEIRSNYQIALKAYENNLSENNFDKITFLIESKNEQIKSLVDEIKRYEDVDYEYVKKISNLEKNKIIKKEEEARENIDNILDIKGSLTTTISEIKKKIESFKTIKNRKDLDDEFSSFDNFQLEGIIENNNEEIRVFTERKDSLQRKITKSYQVINELKKLDRETKLLQKNIRLDDDIIIEKFDHIKLPETVEEREILVDSINKIYLQSLNELNYKEKIAKASYNKLLEFSKKEKFASVEPVLSSEIIRGSFELSIESVDNQLVKIDERIEGVNAVIDESQKDLDLCVNKLMNHVTMAFSKLKRAVKISKLPDSLSKFGGKKVLKLNTDINSIPFSVRKNELENYVKSLTEKDSIPGVGTINGDELTAEAVSSILRSKNQKGVIGIKIIKLSRNVSYTPVENVTGSGGESMTSALLLYLVMAQLRAESKGGSKDSAGGFLLMDNPFAKATKPEFVKAQVELANSLGFQLIYATGIKDLNAISQFAHIVQLRPFSITRSNEKVNVEKITIESSEITTLN